MKFRRDTERQFAHKTNIARYQKMLAGYLTPSERDFIECRLAEEQEALRNLAESVRSGDREKVVTEAGSPSFVPGRQCAP